MIEEISGIDLTREFSMSRHARGDYLERARGAIVPIQVMTY